MEHICTTAALDQLREIRLRSSAQKTNADQVEMHTLQGQWDASVNNFVHHLVRTWVCTWLLVFPQHGGIEAFGWRANGFVVCRKTPQLDAATQNRLARSRLAFRDVHGFDLHNVGDQAATGAH